MASSNYVSTSSGYVFSTPGDINTFYIDSLAYPIRDKHVTITLGPSLLGGSA
jgi:hypothetical protein